MPRRRRICYPGSIHHVTSRGVRKREIYLTPADRIHWLATLGQACRDFDLSCLAYCLMDNHYHLVVRCRSGKLSDAMQLLNGHFGHYFNSRHDLTGHLFQGRYHAELVERDSYLLELIRYVLLNPVRAGLVSDPPDWPWSSCRATIGAEPPPDWLDVGWVRRQFGLTETSGVGRLQAFLAGGMAS